MTCLACTLAVGDRLTVTPRRAGCITCNADNAHLFPVEVVYCGKFGDVHRFGVLKTLLCCGCGRSCDYLDLDCEGEGGYYEVTAYQQSETPLQWMSEPQLLLVLPEQSSLSS